MAVEIRPKGETYRPAESVAETKLPPEFRNHPFIFVHYPTAWEWDAESKRFLPSLSQIVLRPGVNGVGDDLSPRRAIGGSVAKGGVVVRPEDSRLGEWQNFVTRYPVRTPTGKGEAWHYCFRSQEFAVLPNGQAAVIEGSEDFRRFRAHLLDAKIIDEPGAVMVRAVVEVERRGLERKVREARDNPHRASEVEAKRERLAAMEAWIAKRSGAGAVAAPATAKRARAEIAPAVAEGA